MGKIAKPTLLKPKGCPYRDLPCLECQKSDDCPGTKKVTIRQQPNGRYEIEFSGSKGVEIMVTNNLNLELDGISIELGGKA